MINAVTTPRAPTRPNGECWFRFRSHVLWVDWTSIARYGIGRWIVLTFGWRDMMNHRILKDPMINYYGLWLVLVGFRVCVLLVFHGLTR